MTSSMQPSLPLPKHALTWKYLRLRLIATFIQYPTRFLIAISYIFRDPRYLKRYDVIRERITVPSRRKGKSIKVIVYKPKGHALKPSPVHINWHGSGFVLPCLGADTEICCYLAAKLGCIVLDADYAKSPQSPFPAAPQDAEDVCLYVLAHPELYDTSKVTVGGSSAGANLALGVGAKLGPDKIQAVCSIAPPTDFRPSSRPKKAPLAGHRAALPPKVSLFFDSCYLVINSDRADPLLSPICADTSNFPKSVFISAGTGDTLHRDGKSVIEKLKAEGHPNAIFLECIGAGHGYEKFQFKSDGPDNWAMITLEKIVEVIRASWSQNDATRNGSATASVNQDPFKGSPKSSAIESVKASPKPSPNGSIKGTSRDAKM